MARGLAKRGSKLEMLIDMVNNEYRNKGVADVRKVPPPLKVGKVTGKSVNAYLDKATWLDYTGVYLGHSLIFDAKETQVERFPLDNLADHQYATMKSWDKNRGIAFLIVAFWLKGKNEPEIDCKYTFVRFLELGLELGFTFAQIENAYYAKNRINHERQDNGY